MIRFLLSRPVTLIMLLSACMLFGMLTLFRMDLAFTPDTGQPGLTILVRYPGTDARKMDTQITKKLEEAIARIPGVAKITAISSEGKTKIHVLYPYGVNLDLATMDILDAIAPVGAAFPQDVEKPVVLRFDPSDAPVFTVAITGINLPAFRKFAEKNLKPAFERVKGVSEVIVAGGEMQEILVSVDRYKSAARNIPLLSVVHALQFANYAIPGGIIPGKTRELYTRTLGRFTNLDQLEQVRVGGKDEPLTLDQIADIHRNAKPLENKALSRGKEQIAIYVKKGGKASLLSVTAALNATLKKIQVPKDAKADVIYDASVFLKESINQLALAAIMAAIIAAAVLFFFLRSVSATFIVSISIPLSISVAFTAIGLLRIPLDVMTLSGLAIGIGMMVDNSIVILESIHIATRTNSDALAAALEGTRRSGIAVFASTLTTVCVFVPILFLSPKMRLLFGNLSAAVSISLFASLGIALTAVPVFSMLAARRPARQTAALPKQSSSAPFDRLLALSVRKPRWILVLLVAAAALVVPSLGQEILSPLSGDTLFAFIEFPSGTDLPTTSRISVIADTIIRSYPFVKKTDARVEKAHTAITIKLDDTQGVDQDQALATLSQRFKTFRRAFVHFSAGDATAGGGQKSLTVDVTGEDLQLIQHWAKKGAAVTSRLPGIREVVLLFKEGPPEYLIKIDREKAALFGLSARDIGLEVRSAIFGPIATKYLESGHETDIRVRFKDGNVIKPDLLPDMPVTVGENRTTPLKAIAFFERTVGDGRILRKNGLLTASFQIRYTGIDLGTAISSVKAALDRLSAPKEIRFNPGEEAEELQQSGASGLFAVLLAIILVYMVLASLYESFILPVIVLSSIPPALATALLVLFVLKLPVSIPVFLGFVMLAGLVVNNAILIIDEAQKNHRKTNNAFSAATQAVQQRLRPLLITTLTTVLGLLPLLFSGGGGGALYKPMAITVLSGMIGSTAISLFLVPTLFILVAKNNIALPVVQDNADPEVPRINPSLYSTSILNETIEASIPQATDEDTVQKQPLLPPEGNTWIELHEETMENTRKWTHAESEWHKIP